MSTVTHTLEGPDLEALLARVPAELGAGAVIVAANKLRSGGLGGFFTRELFEVVVEVPEGAGPADDALAAGHQPPERSMPSSPRVSTEAIGFAGVLDRMVRDAGIEDSAPRAVGPALAHLDAERPDPVDPFEPLLPARVDRSGHPVDISAADAPIPVPAPLPPAVVPVPAVPDRPALDQRWLARVGVPTNVAARMTTVSDDPAVELFHLMEHLALPEPLPSGPGAVIAVVGRRSDALEVAVAFAAELGTSPEDIFVAAPSYRGASVAEHRRLGSIDLALERRRSWRRRRQPTIIAVEAALGRQRSTWATHLLDAVEPTMVWGVVEASRKAEDIRAWAARLGGLDALAVTDLEDTVSPAAVLGAGVPVGLLDGHEASASRWTAILAEHLEVAA